MITPDHIRYTVTITDPKIFTRPWTMSLVLYRHLEPNAQLLAIHATRSSWETRRSGRVVSGSLRATRDRISSAKPAWLRHPQHPPLLAAI
jgi:hypothetical protein